MGSWKARLRKIRKCYILQNSLFCVLFLLSLLLLCVCECFPAWNYMPVCCKTSSCFHSLLDFTLGICKSYTHFEVQCAWKLIRFHGAVYLTLSHLLLLNQKEEEKTRHSNHTIGCPHIFLSCTRKRIKIQCNQFISLWVTRTSNWKKRIKKKNESVGI